MFDFSIALRYLKTGSHLSRQKWNGKGIYLFYVDHYLLIKAEDLPLLDFIAIKKDGKICPWSANQEDILANDWKISKW
jgi:hypothetical protein